MLTLFVGGGYFCRVSRLLCANQGSAPGMHYCFLAAPLLSLSPFPFLIGNCSNLPFGTQGRSWRLEFIPNKQEMGNTKRLLYPGAPQSLARFHSAYVHFLGNNFQSICFMCTLFICCVLLQIDVRTLPLLLNILFSEFTKKDVQLESCKLKFYLGQNEDCNPGGSISDSSKRVLQSSSGGRSIYKVLVKGEFNTMKHSFYKRFFVSHEDLTSPWRI